MQYPENHTAITAIQQIGVHSPKLAFILSIKDSGQHPHFCQHRRQHFSGILVLGFCARSPGSQFWYLDSRSGKPCVSTDSPLLVERGASCLSRTFCGLATKSRLDIGCLSQSPHTSRPQSSQHQVNLSSKPAHTL